MIYVVRQWQDADLVGIALHLERHRAAFQVIESWTSPLYPHLEPGDVVIGLGGPPSVTHLGEKGYEWPYVTYEAGFVGQAMALDIPLLGICLSHQLRARLAHGTVSEGAPAKGVVDIELTEAGRAHWLFEGMPDRFPVFAWHRDQVVSLPPDATVLARSAGCPIEAVAWDEQQVSVQFHPEALRDIMLARLDRDEMARLGTTPEQLVASLPADYPQYTARLFDNFLARAGVNHPSAGSGRG